MDTDSGLFTKYSIEKRSDIIWPSGRFLQGPLLFNIDAIRNKLYFLLKD